MKKTNVYASSSTEAESSRYFVNCLYFFPCLFVHGKETLKPFAYTVRGVRSLPQFQKFAK